VEAPCNVEASAERVYQRDHEFYLIPPEPSCGSAYNIPKGPHRSPYSRDNEEPISSEESAAGHQNLGWHRQETLLARKNGGEPGQDEAQEENGDDDGHKGNDNRIDHSAFDLRSGLGLGVEILGELLEHRAERAGDFGGGNHVYVKVGEYLRVLAEGLGEALSGFDSLFQVDDDGLELVVGVLLGDGLKRILKAYSGSYHNSELVGEVEDVPPARSELKPETLHFLPAVFFRRRV